MALQLAWSPEALEDVEAIAAYIERVSPWYAHAVASRIFDTAEAIPEFPEMGRIVPEVDRADTRERFVFSYRLIYRIETQRILILAVIHGSRLMQPFMPRFERGGPA